MATLFAPLNLRMTPSVQAAIDRKTGATATATNAATATTNATGTAGATSWWSELIDKMSATLASPPRTSDKEPHASTSKDQGVAQEAFEANEHRDSDVATEASDCSAMEHELELEIVKRELSLVRERLAMTEEDNKTLRATLEDARICASADPYDWSHTYCCDAAGVNTAMDFAFVPSCEARA
ncbi:hypothetical protein P43SY_011010 [Pythium insidiosum]|uniref:Uncharacterized protein n=1 Tax=Pythium insidiosum TaxID=114742 RepID=A0AAD5Q2Q3_PYTIN|nr:hypothetical protein P43SY_011010 [Pythium insidiosum]